jgi:hypothetical protein
LPYIFYFFLLCDCAKGKSFNLANFSDYLDLLTEDFSATR